MKQRSPWVIFIVLLSGIFVTLEASAFLTPALPYIAKHFALPTEFVGIVTVCYYITAIALAPLFGRLGDQIGRKKIVVAGMLIFSLSEFLASFSPTLTVFLIARVIQGFGYACIFPNVFAYISDIFTEEKRGRAIGVFMLFIYIATGTGGLISGFLIETFNWRAIFVTSGTIAFIGFLLVAIFVPSTTLQVTKTKLNYTGAVIFMLFIASVVSIPMSIGFFGLFSPFTLIQFVLIFVILASLLMYDRRSEAPTLDLSILKIRGIAISAILITGQNIIMLSILYTLMFYGANRADWTAVEIGLITTVNFSIAAIISPFIGRYLDKYRPVYVIIFALASSLVGVIIFYFVNMSSSLTYVLLVMVFIGICSGCINAALMKIVITEAPEGKKGVGTGLFTLFKDLGLPLGATFGSTLYGISQSKGFENNITVAAADNGINAKLSNDILTANTTGEISSTLSSALSSANITFEALVYQINDLSTEFAIQTIALVCFGLCLFILILSLTLLKKSPKLEQEQNTIILKEDVAKS
ncbi:MFS transporter [Oceanobacillus longus]|uniref:MFS transporter n=1 Tax=Oceanobacillus longus TaxID=930120 RepID=A0ABV8H046_9BACI